MKKMIKVDELKEWANDLKPILFDINVSLNNILILKHEHLNNLKVNYNEVYVTLLYQQHFILIIQLAKIFTYSKWQKRNIHTLFKTLQDKELDPEILSKHNKPDNFNSREEILAAIEEFKVTMEGSTEIIDRIYRLRNKVFAHTEPEYTNETIDIDDYSILAYLSYQIYNTIFGKVLGDNFIFKPNISNRYDLRSLVDSFE